MIGLLLDEMYPLAAAQLLRKAGHDVVHVGEVGLRASPDPDVAAWARAARRGMVTENLADYAVEDDIVLVFVLKRHLPRGSAQPVALARLLSRWLRQHPEPYTGHHWPEPSAPSDR